jgi:hypothetical protein
MSAFACKIPDFPAEDGFPCVDLMKFASARQEQAVITVTLRLRKDNCACICRIYAPARIGWEEIWESFENSLDTPGTDRNMRVSR